MSIESLERITPTKKNLNYFFEKFPDHKQRYEFACSKLSSDMRIADMACGAGYGSWLMSSRVGSVVGVDISEDALAHARSNFSGNNVEFIHGDEYLFESAFDVVISFETIEHMDESDGDDFLCKIRKSLKRNGLLIISTPINKTENKINVTEFHIREYDDYEFPKKLEENGFEIIEMLGQGSPYHEKLYGVNDSQGLSAYLKHGAHRFFPKSFRNFIKKIILGDPNEGLKISPKNWRNSMIQIAVCKVK